ncbi:tRNA (adenosine(37)-N6)-threonylcarbamoyltransferase complex transferase subunit TsaD [Dethiobacter alkaliphilus]|uniref:N(6)-L-threonylcarbamoyladenine synthase n=1 Tax=Dethiobacter alkaliphilus AHT 1 TaxID=555088 RepID=C0GE31_DETAL|nr:O-sialoglycoprotein endopeptidase [Dethiobacter alkaliphilus]EEG78325.1 O-sialoglycoprotein endopeptidase [Dethiobacter alkaliphilus AHT 1]
MFLGIDTSCYTTSLAVMDTQGRLLCEKRTLLTVPKGERGLRQSDGVFQHLQNLPRLAEEVAGEVGPLKLQAVAASVCPRPVEGSYMPVFTVGTSFGRSLAAAFGVPFLSLSHQEGHILAGMWSAGVDWPEFYALQVSGGTTELLFVRQNNGLKVAELGGSADLHAGQFIDRVGVALGLSFPAGPAVEKLGNDALEVLPVPVSVQGSNLSFSGPESHVQRVIASGEYAPAAVARGVEKCVAESLWRVLRTVRKEHGAKPVLFVGGVMANQFIRGFLAEKLGDEAAFAQIRFAGDNAAGAAVFAQKFTN